MNLGRMIKGAVFDLDGTILDSLWIWEEIDRRFLEKRGIPMPQDYGEAVSKMEFRQIADYTIERFGLKDRPEELMEEWLGMSREAYRSEIQLKPGAKEFLEMLSAKGLVLAIATSSQKVLYEPALRRGGVYDLFSAVAESSETGKGKDCPDVYLLAAGRLGLRPEECIVFEDIATGLRSAASEGFTTVGVFDRYSREDQDALRAAADLYLEDFLQEGQDKFVRFLG